MIAVARVRVDGIGRDYMRVGESMWECVRVVDSRWEWVTVCESVWEWLIVDGSG